MTWLKITVAALGFLSVASVAMANSKTCLQTGDCYSSCQDIPKQFTLQQAYCKVTYQSVISLYDDFLQKMRPTLLKGAHQYPISFRYYPSSIGFGVAGQAELDETSCNMRMKKLLLNGGHDRSGMVAQFCDAMLQNATLDPTEANMFVQLLNLKGHLNTKNLAQVLSRTKYFGYHQVARLNSMSNVFKSSPNTIFAGAGQNSAWVLRYVDKSKDYSHEHVVEPIGFAMQGGGDLRLLGDTATTRELDMSAVGSSGITFGINSKSPFHFGATYIGKTKDGAMNKQFIVDVEGLRAVLKQPYKMPKEIAKTILTKVNLGEAKLKHICEQGGSPMIVGGGGGGISAIGSEPSGVTALNEGYGYRFKFKLPCNKASSSLAHVPSMHDWDSVKKSNKAILKNDYRMLGSIFSRCAYATYSGSVNDISTYRTKLHRMQDCVVEHVVNYIGGGNAMKVLTPGKPFSYLCVSATGGPLHGKTQELCKVARQASPH